MSSKTRFFHDGITRRSFLKSMAAASTAIVAAPSEVLSAEKNDVKNEKPYGASTLIPDKVVRAVCSPNCTGTCAVNTYVKNDRIIRVEPGDFPDPAYKRICIKGISYAMQKVYNSERIKYPMKRAEGAKRGEGKFVRISWEQAYKEIGEKLNAIKAQYGARACSWINMTGNYGLLATYSGKRFADSFGGTNLENLGIMGDLAANMGFMLTTGMPPHHSQEGHTLDQLMDSKLMLCWGANFAETSTPDMHFYLDAQAKGMKIILIDPRYSTMASKADQYVQVRPATDAALAYGMIQHIIANNMHDEEYIRKNTSACMLLDESTKKHVTKGKDIFYILNGGKAQEYKMGDAVPDSATLLSGKVVLDINGKKITCRTVFQIFVDQMNAEYTPEKASKICETPAETIKQLAKEYASVKPAAVYVSQGTQRYYNGHLTFRAILILGAVCGNIGKASSGVSWTGGTLFKVIFANPFEWQYPVKFANPDKPQMDKGVFEYSASKIFDIMATDKPHKIKSLWVTTYGIGTQAPMRDKWFKDVFPKLDLIVVNEILMTDGAMHADYVLPVTSYYEQQADLVGSWMNLYLQYRKPAIKPMFEAKDDVVIFSELATRMKLPGNWNMTPEQHCDFIMNTFKTTKGPFKNDAFVNMDIATLKRDGVVRIAYPTDYVPFADQKFATQTGKFELYSESMIPFGQEVPLFMEPLEGKNNLKSKKYPLVFMNSHGKYSAHSTHKTLKWINEVDPEPRLLINPEDATERGMQDGEEAEVFNDRGRFRVKILVTPGIKKGVLNIFQGWWAKQFPGNTHYADLLHIENNPAQAALLDVNYAPYDNLVQVASIKK